MTREYARAPIGRRAHAHKAPKQSNLSLIGSIRQRKTCAIYPYDGPVDGFRFLSYLEHHLLPNLNDGDVVVMDNLRVHHIAEVKEILAKAGASPLYLPPYSPERNPIEEVWSPFKQKFRSDEPRTIPEIVATMTRAWNEITTENLHAYFAHAGYD